VSHPDGLHDKCKKCARKESQKYYNPERQAAYERENRDKRNKQRKARPNFHKLQREYARIRRALKVGTNEMYTSDDERITLKEFGNKCYRCKSHDHLCIDHHRPLSAGFPLSLTNAVVLCGSCNASKGPKRPEEFYGQKKCRALDKKLKKIGLKYMD
jgi:5-methylcytosine-specific restriction endonuclease McrA